MLQAIAGFIERHQHWFGFPLVVVMSAVAFFIAIIQPPFIEQVELASLDYRFQARGVKQPDQRVIIVAVDNDSLSEVGHWPWPRDKLGKIVDRILGEYGAAVLGFDIMFSEAQENPISESLRLLDKAGKEGKSAQTWLKRHQQLGDMDAVFEKLLEKYRDRIVLGYFFYPYGADVPVLTQANLARESEMLQSSAMTAEISGRRVLYVPRMAAIEGNLPRFSQAADAAGFFNFFPDTDGTVRRIPLIAELDGYIYPGLDLQTLRVALGWPPMSVIIDEAGVERIYLGDRDIRVDQSGSMFLNHYGPGQTFTHIPAADVMAGDVDPALFKDAIVLLGVTAVGVFDYRPSPFDAIFPGVEGHATAMANILNAEEIKRPQVLEISELFAVLLLGLLCGRMVYRRGAVLQSLSIIGVPMLLVVLSLWLFSTYALWLKVTYLLLAVLLATVPITLFEYVIESRKRAFIHEAFSYYLAPKVVERLAKHPESLSLGGEERHLTAMFSDIAGFSSFAEGLEPQALVHFLNQYLTAMSDIILKHGGTIDKYEGDAIIAFFGAPLDMPDHASRCVLAALEQQQTLHTMRKQWAKDNYPVVHTRIGINSGQMVVGNMGTHRRMNYTIMGDHANLASRLEGVCKVYSTPILISRDSYLLIRDQVAARFIDRVRVVGRAQTVDIYQPMGKREQVTKEQTELCRNYEKAWEMMSKRNFTEAEKCLADLYVANPDDGPCEVMLQRVREFRKAPPAEDWDSVYVLESK
ncbi:MAG: CHASE2 domain-containing protein [Mariprofundaceae bacterium]